MQLFIIVLSAILLSSTATAQPGRLRVSPDGRYLLQPNGKPFFWLGDTGWELFHRLNGKEIRYYLDNRATKGFSVIQAVLLAEFDGLRKPNRYGHTPLHNNNPATPNEAYFQLVDSTVTWAAKRGLYMGLLPTWGDKVAALWGVGPVVFDSTNAYTYGKWLGRRYRTNTNIVWILGGDRPAAKDSLDWRPIWRQMARGIREGAGGKALIAYHPSGGGSSTQWLHTEPWLDINMFQSGHGNGHDAPCWETVARDRALQPAKPVLDAEPNYEDHPVNPWPKWNPDNGYYRAYDVRKQLYRSVFAGACGVTYGHHAVWQFMSEREEAINYPDRGWANALDRPGAFQAGLLARLMQEHGAFIRIPDNSLIANNGTTKATHMEACRNEAGNTALIYMPVGGELIVNAASLKGNTFQCQWFDPKNGKYVPARITKTVNGFKATPPSTGVRNDWVLMIQTLLG